jgi:hypothetical protein
MKNPKYWRKRTTEDKFDKVSMALLQIELTPIREDDRFNLEWLIKNASKAMFQKKAKKLRRRQLRIEQGRFKDK